MRFAPARALISAGVPSASSLREQPAPVDHQDPVRGLIRLLQVVRGEQQRLAGGDLLLHARPEQPAGLHVHRRGGLVEDDQVAFADDRQREPDPLRLTAGEPVDPLVGDGLDAGPAQRGRHRHRVRLQPGHQRHQLAHRHLRHEAAGLQHRADLPGLHGVVRVTAEHPDASGRGLA
jgi:hypothetical protein